MPRTNKNSTHGNNNLSQDETEVPSSQEDTSSSEKMDPEASFDLYRAQQIMPNMFMPYTEGTRMDWMVNDNLFHRYLKWHLKCENILECEYYMSDRNTRT